MSLARRSSLGAVFLSLSTLINIVIGFLGGIVLARLLSPNDFGTYGFATTLAAFVDIRVKLQLEQKFLQHSAEPNDYLDAFFTLNTILALISFVLMLLAAFIVTVLGRTDVAICLIVVSALSLLDPLTLAIRLSIEKQIAFRAIAFIQTIASVSQFGATLLAAFYGLGVWSLLLGLIIGTILNLGCFFYVAPRRPRWHIHRPTIREFLSYGLKYGLVYATSAIILTQFDNLVISTLDGTYAFGLYQRAYSTALWPTLLISAVIARISLPTYTHIQHDRARMKRMSTLIQWFVLTLTIPIVLIFVTIPHDFIFVVYGEKWSPSAPILQCLAIFGILRPLWDDMISMLVATQRQGQMARVVFWQAIFLLLLAPPLTWFYGAVGTALSVGIAFMFSAAFFLHFSYTQLQINVARTAGLPLLNGLLSFISFLMLTSLWSLNAWPAWLRLCIEVCCLFGFYTLFSLLTMRNQIIQNLYDMSRIMRG